MKFLFWLENHNPVGQRSLEDVIGIIGKQLRALGHQAIWDTTNRGVLLAANEGYNIIVEGFTEGIVKKFAELHGKGARFICIATEEPTPKGFNWGTQPEMIARQKCFPDAAKYFDGIVHLVPGKHVTDWYGQFAPTAYAELGYAPSLVRQDPVKNPPFDFGFYGSMTKRRMKILKELARNCTGGVKLMTDFRTQNERDQAMQQAKVIIQLRKFDAMGLVSSSRCCTALCLGRPVVAEPHELSKPWDEIVKFSESTEHFVTTALMVRANWRGVHSQQMARFQAALPPEACIGKALDEIGVLKQRVAA